MNIWIAIVAVMLLIHPAAAAREKTVQRESLAAYLERVQGRAPETPAATLGSLWTDTGKLAFLTGDYKACKVGDLITIMVVHDVTASNGNSLSTSRNFSSTSAIQALAGHLSTSGVQAIFSPSSTESLAGKAQASTTSSLQTKLTGRVVAVLQSGALVVEAERQLTMNNERQTVLLRGLVRIGDIAPDNTVQSNSIGDLELELKGKGVLSDGTRSPNPLTRWILRIIGF